jgi:glucose/arabinose dehydrogenase
MGTARTGGKSLARAIVLVAACWLPNTLPAGAAPGDRFNIRPNDLPKPDPASPPSLTPDFVPPPPDSVPQVPRGFAITQFASGAGYIRSLAVAPNGDVFVVRPQEGEVLHLRDTDHDGKADQMEPFVSGFREPHGIAIRGGQLYISDLNAVWRAPYQGRQTIAFSDFKRVTTARDLRPGGLHPTRDIVLDQAGRVYLALSAREDLSEAPLPEATIQLVAGDGSMSTFATGLRNVEGLAFYPGTNDLWVTVNERDTMGPHLPADFLAQVKQGDFFGWPYAYNGPHPDPDYGKKRPDMVAKTRTPEVLFKAHSAPLGLVFYTGKQFPADYRNNAFVAIHASGHPDKPDGYKVVRVRFQDGKPVGGYEDFVTGFFSTSDGKVSMWGSPSQLAVANDGSLLFVDDKNNCVWRVTYQGK